MRKIVLTCILIIISFWVDAQEQDMISLGTYVLNEPLTIPYESVSLLESRLKKAVVDEGFGDDKAMGRFALVAKCDILEKDIAPTTPPRISQKIEISFLVVDMIENKTYASCKMTVSGIGVNETKAFSTAFQKVSSQNKQIKQMLDDTKKKILDYYTNSCSQIIINARTLSANREYDEAIFILMSVPNVSQICYSDCHQAASEIYQQKIDDECIRILEQAKNKWSVSQTGETALEIADIISNIDPRSGNYSEVITFRQSVSDKLAADEQYRREQQLQKEAQIAAEAQRQWDFKIKKYEDDVKFKNSLLDACRSVGEIFGSKFEIPQINLFRR